MEDALQLRLLILVLPVVLGGASYAALVAATGRLFRTDRARFTGKAALCWFVGLSAVLWVGFEVVDARAAAIHSRNIGIPIVFAWAWVTLVLPAPFVGHIMLSLGDKWIGWLGNR